MISFLVKSIEGLSDNLIHLNVVLSLFQDLSILINIHEI